MNYRNPETTRCTAARKNGKFCDDESLPDAPFPICVHHAAEVMRYLQSYLPKTLEDKTIAIARAVVQDRKRRPAEPQGFVYYLQVGQLIKIGHTVWLRQRIGQYPPDARLLATEPGTRSLEAQRHREFADDLKYRNEWFSPSPELIGHIADLKAKAA